MQKVEIKHFLNYVKKPGRYLNNELNCKKKTVTEKKLNFALAFPDLYEIGMSHLGLKILYSIINREENFVADRVYAPAQDLIDILRKNKIPLFSIEDKIPLNQFDVVGFTLQYELTYANIPLMLELANIPILAENREENSPLIIAGGPGAFNPEPLSIFFDAFVIGDGEDIIVEIGKILWQNKNIPRTEKLQKLSKLKGVYVPQFYQQISDKTGTYIVPKNSENHKSKIEKNIFADFDNFDKIHFPHLAPLIQIIHDRSVIEIMRGCSRGCRFCQAGMIYRPVRERDEEVILDIANQEVKMSGWEEISLSSLSTSDYSQIEYVISKLTENFPKTATALSLPSLRIDAFDKKFAKSVTKMIGGSLTFAPEAGSQRLRNILNKQISEEDIFDSILSAIAIGLHSVKLYFMIGLPFETENDIQEIINLIEKIHTFTPKTKRLKINVTLSAFIPKPFTPFQWSALEKRENLLEKIYAVKNHFKKDKKVKIKYHSVEQSLLEAVISRGDRKVGKLILDSYKNGAKFDAWDEFFDFSIWAKSAQKNDINFDEYSDSKDINQNLCWEHIDAGIDKEFLKNEFRKSKNGEITLDCRESSCQNCGICEKAEPKYVDKKTKQKTSFTKSNISKKEFQSVNFKYRIFYKKIDNLRFFSHRDLMRMIYKIVRKSGLPTQYTKGFSPHPKLSFGPPMSLGISGENEFFDINLLRKIREKEIFENLNFNLPKGFILKKVEFLTSINQKISNYKFEEICVEFSHKFNWKNGLLAFENKKFLIEKRGKVVNLKDVIQNIRLDKNNLTIEKKISGANIFDILENIFQYPWEKVDKLNIIRKKCFRKI